MADRLCIPVGVHAVVHANAKVADSDGIGSVSYFTSAYATHVSVYSRIPAISPKSYCRLKSHATSRSQIWLKLLRDFRWNWLFLGWLVRRCLFRRCLLWFSFWLLRSKLQFEQGLSGTNAQLKQLDYTKCKQCKCYPVPWTVL